MKYLVIDNDFFQNLVKSLGYTGNISGLSDLQKESMVAEVESTLTAIKDSYEADEIIGTYKIPPFLMEF
ncbi:hypothetical protein [Acetobacter lovaniensis]|jgi:hypothetical protein|uniref:Uncharacterized protein n=1 Tax=Acetobacter lovaniensis TaxID=104100 RepID=A0A841QLI2_9PROT|nr:hypothetical protein [Acetobacter lovaniensis]MBB6458832.1 hypothetical protein [Acetobacter lovaniensis]MCP1240962.1 hypothetical protein [Acetobacter lovaniensis]NHN83009.1 hypothetical protein [Acetobacter lovaniensis]GBQ72805.1 hypothetical protein AA0474_2791 [Acetobacter lovaniensis NRIC 0474]